MKKLTPFYLATCLLLIALGVGAQSPEEASQAPCQPCQALKQLQLPDVRITAAAVLEKPVAHCKVTGVIGKEIRFEVALPDEWNARFTMSGNGGFAGAIRSELYIYLKPLHPKFLSNRLILSFPIRFSVAR